VTTSMSIPHGESAKGIPDLAGAMHAYAMDGACCLRSVVSQRWIETLRGALQQGSAAPTSLSKVWRAPDGEGRFFQDVFVWRHLKALRDFTLQSGIGCTVASVLQTKELRLYSDHVFVRDMGTTKETPWHQDESYCFVAGRHFCSLWLPLDAVSRAESLQLVKGSHTWNLCAPIEFASKAKYAGSEAHTESVPVIDGKGYELLSWDMQPGDCILFSARTLHGSAAYPPTTGPRRVYVTRWIGDDARYRVQRWTVPPLPVEPGLSEGDQFSGELFPIAYPSAGVVDVG
jgi:ectoine hydroxylase-related dioxygenase (phytanoyl-CoA dioxygenase family)